MEGKDHQVRARRGSTLPLVLLFPVMVSQSPVWGQEAPGVRSATEETTTKGIRDRARFEAQRTMIRNIGTPQEVRILEGNAVLEIPYGTTKVRFKADTIAFEWAKEVVTATGNVVIEDGTHTVRSHTMVYDAPERRAVFAGRAKQPMGVLLTQKLDAGDTNSYQTDWLRVAFGPQGLDSIETGRGEGQFYLTGEEPLPVMPEAASGPLGPMESSGPPRKLSPPVIESGT